MKTEFDIITYVGAKPLLFGMKEDEVEKAVGKPSRRFVDSDGDIGMFYPDFNVRLSAKGKTVVHIGFGKGADVLFRGINVFRDKDAFGKIVSMDSSPWETYGFIVLLDLGITLTGFHDNDPSQLAITCFEKGGWDEHKADFKQFRLPRK